MSIDAIGYVRRDVSRARQPWDEIQIRSVAKRLGYNLRKTVVFTSSVPEPERRLGELADRSGIDAIIVPSVEHFSDRHVPAELVQIVDVITTVPECTYARWANGELPCEIQAIDDGGTKSSPRPHLPAIAHFAPYTHRYLPTSIDAGTGCALLKVGEIAAITMPGALGVRVRDALRARRVTSVPIVLHTCSRRWTFLLTPDIPFDDHDLNAEMYRASVTVAPYGAAIALPTPADTSEGYRVWKELPSDAFLPSAAVVIEVIRQCVHSNHGARA